MRFFSYSLTLARHAIKWYSVSTLNFGYKNFWPTQRPPHGVRPLPLPILDPAPFSNPAPFHCPPYLRPRQTGPPRPLATPRSQPL